MYFGKFNRVKLQEKLEFSFFSFSIRLMCITVVEMIDMIYGFESKIVHRCFHLPRPTPAKQNNVTEINVNFWHACDCVLRDFRSQHRVSR